MTDLKAAPVGENRPRKQNKTKNEAIQANQLAPTPSPRLDEARPLPSPFRAPSVRPPRSPPESRCTPVTCARAPRGLRDRVSPRDPAAHPAARSGRESLSRPAVRPVGPGCAKDMKFDETSRHTCGPTNATPTLNQSSAPGPGTSLASRPAPRRGAARDISRPRPAVRLPCRSTGTKEVDEG